MINNSGVGFFFLPEDGSAPKILPPGETRDVDAIFGPEDWRNPQCIKIPDNCSGEINSNGLLSIVCDYRRWVPIHPKRFTWWPGRPTLVPLDRLGKKGDEFESWESPYSTGPAER